MLRKFLAVAAVLLAAIVVVGADFCAKGRVEIQGNWFCQPVDAITYSNVGTAGTYNDVTDMASDGTCSSTPESFSGPIAPLDEEISFHFRGPLRLKQFAAYTPLVSPVNRRETSPAHIRRHGHQHKDFHRRSRADNGIHGKHKRQEVTATIDGQIVSWKSNWFGDTATTASAKASTSATSSAVWVTATIDGKVVSWVSTFGETATTSRAASVTPAVQMVTAKIDGQVVSWPNNWFGESVMFSEAASVTPSAQMVTATINGQVVSWTNNWFGGSAIPTPAPVSATAVAGQAKFENAVAILPTTASSVPAASPSGTPPVIDKSTTYERIGYYNSVSQTLDNLVFLGNYGGQGSGVFDYNFGASLSYVNCNGTGGAPSPQILADVTLLSETEVTIMTARECGNDGSCGYVRPGAIAYHGFAGANKVFMVEFEMPMDGMTGFEGNMPAIWALNAKIPRTSQYGNITCSCWESGCGEFDIVEALNDGSAFLKSTLHDNTPGGDADYLVRPETETMKLAVIFSSSSSTLHIQVLPNSTDFSSSITAGEIEALCASSTSNPVSLFSIS